MSSKLIPQPCSHPNCTAIGVIRVGGNAWQRQGRGSQSLKIRGLAVFNSDTVWLIGDDWGERQPVQQPNPFAFKMPWEILQ